MNLVFLKTLLPLCIPLCPSCFLCGEDAVTGKSFERRRQELAEIFGLKHYGGGSGISAIKQEMKSNTQLENNVNSIINRFYT